MFQGFVQLEGTLTGYLQVRDADGQPIAPDSAPTWRAYGASGPLTGVGGTSSLGHTGTITGVTNANPAVITSAAHKLVTGQRVTIASVGGSTGVNGTRVVTVVDANTFSVAVAAGGAYTSGGTWSLTGFYRYTVDALASSGFDTNQNYKVYLAWAVSSAARAEMHGFGVV